MRVTNAMSVNNLLLNLNRSMNTLDKLQYQAATGNKIQFPSDNPIVASRALKFRTDVSETNQFLTNVGQGLSWMSATESAFKNINEILCSIREKADLAATDSYQLDDRKIMVREILELTKELTTEINVNYAGRYVFSGFRTDEPPMFATPNERSFKITQEFKPQDISVVATYSDDKTDPTVQSTAQSITRIIIPYTQVDGSAVNVYSTDSSTDPLTVTTTTYNVTKVNSKDPGAYDSNDGTRPGTNECIYVQDTGEIILPKGTNKPLTVEYSKTGFQPNEINPSTYFTCTETFADSPSKNYDMSKQSVQYEFGTNNKMQINSLAKDSITPSLVAEINELINFINNTNNTDESELKNRGMTDEEIKEFYIEENKVYQSVIHDRINSFFTRIDSHISQVSKEHTDLGARINRLEFVETRLKDDKINFMALRDDNELVDMAEVMIALTSQLSIYQSALNVGGNIIQKSLVDFIR